MAWFRSWLSLISRCIVWNNIRMRWDALNLEIFSKIGLRSVYQERYANGKGRKSRVKFKSNEENYWKLSIILLTGFYYKGALWESPLWCWSHINCLPLGKEILFKSASQSEKQSGTPNSRTMKRELEQKVEIPDNLVYLLTNNEPAVTASSKLP